MEVLYIRLFAEWKSCVILGGIHDFGSCFSSTFWTSMAPLGVKCSLMMSLRSGWDQSEGCIRESVFVRSNSTCFGVRLVLQLHWTLQRLGKDWSSPKNRIAWLMSESQTRTFTRPLRISSGTSDYGLVNGTEKILRWAQTVQYYLSFLVLFFESANWGALEMATSLIAMDWDSKDLPSTTLVDLFVGLHVSCWDVARQ